MVSRFLEKKIEIEMQEVSGNTGNTLELEYYLVESEPVHESPLMKDKEYGIQIVMKQKGERIESIIYRDMFPERSETEKLVRLIADNSVTPVTLPYIIDDLL